jgi:hypothetical protein
MGKISALIVPAEGVKLTPRARDCEIEFVNRLPFGESVNI